MTDPKPYIPIRLVRDYPRPPVDERIRKMLSAMGRPLPDDPRTEPETEADWSATG